MEDVCINFSEKRMYTFSELIKRYFKENAANSYDLNVLTDEIRDKYNLDDRDIPFIKGHIIIAMQLDFKRDKLSDDELNINDSCW